MNIIDYIKKNKDKTFTEFPFTEVDSLILSLLPYIDFKVLIEPVRRKKKTLTHVAEELEQTSKTKPSFFIRNTYKMFNLMKNTKRYGDILLYNYTSIVNKEMQFTALSMKLPTKTVYIAYAGTDTSISGWEEDFKLAYLYPGLSQKYASTYFNKTVSLFDRNVIIGGHSKGGNLAICAGMNGRSYLKKKITGIDTFDSPGFLKEQIESKEYQNIKNKIRMYIPKDSIIGMLLYHETNYTVIKAKHFNILQHDAFTWECNEKELIRDKQTKRSINLENKITTKLEELSIEKRTKVINDLFTIFKNQNINDTKDIKIKDLIKLFKDFKELDKETKNWLVEFLLILFIK